MVFGGGPAHAAQGLDRDLEGGLGVAGHDDIGQLDLDETRPPLRLRPDAPEDWQNFAQAIPVTEALTSLHAAARSGGERWDLTLSDLSSWTLDATDDGTLALVPPASRARLAPLPLRRLAFAQLCAKLSAPAHYIQDLPADLQLENLRWSLSRGPCEAKLRLAGDEVRAVLSPRYAALDDPLLLETVAEVLAEDGYEDSAPVRSLGVGMHTLLRVTLPSEGLAVKPGDVIEHGVDVANSELGLRSVQIAPVTYRPRCTNGLRAWESDACVRTRQVGEDHRLRARLRDILPLAFEEARATLRLWRRAVGTPIEDILSELESLRALGLNRREVERVGLQLLADVPQAGSDPSVFRPHDFVRLTLSVFDMTTAITAAARTSGGVAARLHGEELGHRYLTRRVA